MEKRKCENCNKKISGFYSVKITLDGIKEVKCLKCKNEFKTSTKGLIFQKKGELYLNWNK